MTTTNLRLSDLVENDRQSVPVKISPSYLACLTQVRRHIDQVGIEELAASTLLIGQLHSGIVAALTPDQASEYVAFFNELWSANHRLESYPRVAIDNTEYHLFIVAGHRRYYSCAWLHQAVAKKLRVWSERYKGDYRAELYFNLTAEEALSIQFQENVHSRPPAHEEANAAWCLYRLEERRGNKPTSTSIAKKLGRSPEWVRGALRFAKLPSALRDLADPFVNGAQVTYGVMVQIARLAEQLEQIKGEPLDEQTLTLFANRAFLEGWSPTRAQKWVSSYLENARLNAAGQMQLFSDTATAQPVRRNRATFERSLTGFLSGQRQLVRAVVAHDRRGGFGPDSPFTAGASLSGWVETATLMHEAHELFLDLARREKRFGTKIREGIEPITQCGKSAEKLKKLVPGE